MQKNWIYILFLPYMSQQSILKINSQIDDLIAQDIAGILFKAEIRCRISCVAFAEYEI